MLSTWFYGRPETTFPNFVAFHVLKWSRVPTSETSTQLPAPELRSLSEM
jgi:hypothetical protein